MFSSRFFLFSFVDKGGSVNSFIFFLAISFRLTRLGLRRTTPFSKAARKRTHKKKKEKGNKVEKGGTQREEFGFAPQSRQSKRGKGGGGLGPITSIIVGFFFSFFSGFSARCQSVSTRGHGVPLASGSVNDSSNLAVLGSLFFK